MCVYHILFVIYKARICIIRNLYNNFCTFFEVHISQIVRINLLSYIIKITRTYLPIFYFVSLVYSYDKK